MWQREILVAVIVSKTREFWVKKEVVLGPGTELLYMLRSIYKSDTQGIVEEVVFRELGKKEKGESEWRGISGLLAHTKKKNARTLEGLWAIEHGGCQFRIVQETSCAVGTLRASTTDWR